MYCPVFSSPNDVLPSAYVTIVAHPWRRVFVKSYVYCLFSSLLLTTFPMCQRYVTMTIVAHSRPNLYFVIDPISARDPISADHGKF